jgi:glutathionylspermidine synthase
MLGRMDFAWDGTGPPKLLEYNGDTPSVLVESAGVQLNWQREKHPKAHQSNYMISALSHSIVKQAVTSKIDSSSKLGVLIVKGDEESEGTAEFIRKVA